MRILGTGIDYSSGDFLISPVEEEAFGEAVLDSLQQHAGELQTAGRTRARGTALRGEVERARTVDLGDPRSAGWTFLVNRDDPNRSDIEKALAPLAAHRGMGTADPLVFSSEAPDDWHDWLQENYFGLDLEGKTPPHYVLVVGSPDRVPFHFQSMFDSAASVGRLDFDTVADLQTYVDKVLRHERAADPTASRETMFFATDGGPGDATHFSRRFMVDPLADHVARTCRFPTTSTVADEATKDQLLEAGRLRKPALVYTASHGMAAPKEPLETQLRVNGGICCQHLRGDGMQEWLLTADDIDSATPFFEGAVVFQFACFGYGTPAESDFGHWLGGPTLNTAATFVAALPKKLLAHPRGPIAFIGHVDTAWLHGFDDPNNPYLVERWSSRMTPYKKAVETLLACQPAGLAMSDMNKRFDYANAQLTLTFDRMMRRRLELTPAVRQQLANTFIFRSDAQNYLVFGDPAARLRIPAA
jgi:hypothetical protein